MATVVTDNNLPPILLREHSGDDDHEPEIIHLASNPKAARITKALCGANDALNPRALITGIADLTTCVQCIIMSLDGKVRRRYY